MAYDQKCYDLAALFLSDVQDPVQHEDAHKLAQDIQDVIEDYLSDLERQKQPPEEMPPAMKAELDAAIRMGKGWEKVLDALFTPKVTK